jgi:hypothetical protein
MQAGWVREEGRKNAALMCGGEGVEVDAKVDSVARWALVCGQEVREGGTASEQGAHVDEVSVTSIACGGEEKKSKAEGSGLP